MSIEDTYQDIGVFLPQLGEDPVGVVLDVYGFKLLIIP